MTGYHLIVSQKSRNKFISCLWVCVQCFQGDSNRVASNVWKSLNWTIWKPGKKKKKDNLHFQEEEISIQASGLVLRGLSNSFAYFRDALHMPVRAHDFVSISCCLSTYPKNNRPGFFFPCKSHSKCERIQMSPGNKTSPTQADSIMSWKEQRLGGHSR